MRGLCELIDELLPLSISSLNQPYLRRKGENEGDVLLLRAEIVLQVLIVLLQDQFVGSDQARDHVHNQQAYLERLGNRKHFEFSLCL